MESLGVGMLLQQVAALIARESDKAFQQKLHIGFAQFKILVAVQSSTGLPQREISKILGQTEASVSRQIKLMYDDGLLRSVQKTNNRREHAITLSMRGERLTEEARKIFAAINSEILNGVDVDELHSQLSKVKSLQ